MKKIIVFLLFLGLTNYINAQVDPDGTVEGTDLSINLVSWYNSSVMSSIYTDDAGTSVVTANGDRIRRWEDQSGNGNHLITSDINSTRGRYKTGAVKPHFFNGKDYLDFNDGQYLRVNLPDLTEYTVFVVLNPTAASPPTSNTGILAFDKNTNNASWAVETRGTGNPEFAIRGNDDSGGNFTEKFHKYQEKVTQLFTFRQNVKSGGNNDIFSMYADGVEVADSPLPGNVAEGLVIRHLFLNTRRQRDTFLEVNFAEIIIYDRVLNSCQIEQINLYLGDKYGRDFNNLAANYDYDTPITPVFDFNINGIGTFVSSCATPPKKDIGISDVMTIFNPSSNNTEGEFLTLAHDDEDTETRENTISNVPGSYEERIDQIWRIDEDGNLGTVDVTFDLSTFISDGNLPASNLSLATNFALLINNSATDFSSPDQVIAGATISGNEITFTGINFNDGNYVTLAVEAASITATKLVFTTEPVNTPEGVIMPDIVIELQDASGFLDTDNTSNVTIAINNNPGSGTLSGTLTVAAVGGVATFSGLSINNDGVGYTLIASSSGLPSETSAAFNITPVFSPGGVNGSLALWLKADAGITGGADVSQWNDQSLNSKHATQITSSNQPDASTRTMNFNPTVEFDGSNHFMDLPDNILTAGDDDTAMYVVWRTNIDNTFKRIVSFGSSPTFVSGEGFSLVHGENGGFAGSNFGLQLEISPFDQGIIQPYAIDTPILSTAFTQNQSTNDLEIGLNGAAFLTATEGAANRTLGITNFIGQKATNSERLNGDIAEIIAYNNPQNTTDRQQIESYLALKYGISLDQTGADGSSVIGDYTASNGLPIWDAPNNIGTPYNHDVFGIGLDNDSFLDQRISKSSNSDALIMFSLDDNYSTENTNTGTRTTSHTANYSFLIAANNDATLDFNAVSKPCSCPEANFMQRQWQVQETGSVNDVFVAIHKTAFTGALEITSIGELYLVISDAENLSNPTYKKMTLDGGNNTYRTQHNFNNEQYFSFVKVVSPTMRHGKFFLFDQLQAYPTN